MQQACADNARKPLTVLFFSEVFHYGKPFIPEILKAVQAPKYDCVCEKLAFLASLSGTNLYFFRHVSLFRLFNDSVNHRHRSKSSNKFHIFFLKNFSLICVCASQDSVMISSTDCQPRMVFCGSFLAMKFSLTIFHSLTTCVFHSSLWIYHFVIVRKIASQISLVF